jgi:hypothetical protein
MIIFSRWGFLVLLAMGAGVLCAVGLNKLIAPDVTSGPGFGVFIGVGWLVAAALTWLLVRFVVRPHLDKPRPLYVLHPLPQPVITERGRQTHRQVPAVDPERANRSTPSRGRRSSSSRCRCGRSSLASSAPPSLSSASSCCW